MKFGTLYAYWVSNWGADYCEMARKAKKAGFDVIEIGGGDLEGLADFIEKLGDLSKKASTNMVLSISADKADIPERIAEYAVEL